MPAETPVRTPLEEPTAAKEGLLLDHVPPPASVSVVLAPAHTSVLPNIAPGNGFTVTNCVTLHPAAEL